MTENKLLAVMGSPGSGKTTAAIKLAQALAARKKNVILVFCDPFVPVIPAIVDTGTVHETSLGALFTAPSLTQKQILNACVPVKENEYISFLGYRERENLMHYPRITKDRVLECLVSLRYLADYTILDCAAVFEADPASIVAIEKADVLLYMATANLKGVSYYQSHASMLAEVPRLAEKRVMAIGNTKVGQDWEAVGELYGGVRYMLPFIPELEQQEQELSLFSAFINPDSGPYQRTIEQLLQDIFLLPPEAETKRNRTRSEESGKRGKEPKDKRTFKIPSLRRKGEF